MNELERRALAHTMRLLARMAHSDTRRLDELAETADELADALEHYPLDELDGIDAGGPAVVTADAMATCRHGYVSKCMLCEIEEKTGEPAP